MLAAARDWIRTYDAVVVVGAGASFQAGMPLAGQLSPLVWHALDSHPEVRRSTCDALGVAAGCAKDVIALDWDRIRVGFSQIAADPEARRTFQATFAALDRERAKTPSPAHIALARLVHCGRAPLVISLNWDTLLEEAFSVRYGIEINAQGLRLWKPHGDCRRPEDDWVLPHEPGLIPDSLVARVTELARQRPRTLLIIGYSERDEVVVERLVGPLADRWRVFRVSPSATGEGAIQVAAHEALESLAGELCPDPEFPSWEYVSFARQRGIEAAISGERLGPRDVDVCPRLPHFDSAARSLATLHSVEIAGHPGCGKSITAWQLARKYNLDGWEVLRPNPSMARAGMPPAPIGGSTPWKRVLVIDDTQNIPGGFADQQRELAGPETKVICATTDSQGEHASPVRIPAKAAVETLAADFRKRRAEILPIVRRYDPHVGDAYLDVPIERRIAEAEREETPWQFAFVLRGSWRQAREELQILRDFERADLLLVAVAARQLLSLDAGCAVAEVAQDARSMGRPESWALGHLDLLRRRRAILPGDPLRCPHLQSAAIVIRSHFADRKDSEFEPVVSMLRTAVVEQSPPLRGISWLLHELFMADAFRFIGSPQRALLSPEEAWRIVRRCFSVVAPIERRDGAFLVGTLLNHGALEVPSLTPYYETLKRWLEMVDGTTAAALGGLINTLYNQDKELARRLVESLDPASLAARMAAITPKDGYGWGYYLGRLSVAAGDAWRADLKAALPREAVFKLAVRFQATELVALNEFVTSLAAYDFEFATECLRRALPTVQQRFREDALDALDEANDIHWRLLGHDLFGRTRPTRGQKKLSKAITDALQPERIAAGVVACRYGDWERYAKLLGWVRQVNPTRHRQIVDAIAWEGLEARTTGLWAKPPRELRLLLHALVSDQHGRPVREWVARHAGQIEEIDPITAAVSPEAAVEVVRRGGRFNLGGHNQSDWKLQAWALIRVAEVSRDTAVAALEADQSRIADRLAKLESIDCEQLLVYLRVVERLAPELVGRLLRCVDIKVASASWPKRLQDARGEVRRGARNVIRFAWDFGEGDLKVLAETLSPSTKNPRSKEPSDTDGQS